LLILALGPSVCLDVGANFGLYALAFARCLAPKNGRVHAFEAQRMLAYMVSGTAALNGVENLFVHNQAVGAVPARIPVPRFDYNRVASFGSIEFGAEQKEYIGQPRLYHLENGEFVEVVRLDDLQLENVFLVKIDIEGMEEAALQGAAQLIQREKPILCVEWYKSNKQNLINICKSAGYRVFEWGVDLFCIHPEKESDYGVDFRLPEH
jgi:FkbM family methyltransferase